jgi:hypothetical protein
MAVNVTKIFLIRIRNRLYVVKNWGLVTVSIESHFMVRQAPTHLIREPHLAAVFLYVAAGRMIIES